MNYKIVVSLAVLFIIVLTAFSPDSESPTTFQSPLPPGAVICHPFFPTSCATVPAGGEPLPQQTPTPVATVMPKPRRERPATSDLGWLYWLWLLFGR
jgi:hypothetical protein